MSGSFAFQARCSDFLVESTIAPGLTPGFSIGARLGGDRTDLVSPVVGIDVEYAASDATETKFGLNRS